MRSSDSIVSARAGFVLSILVNLSGDALRLHERGPTAQHQCKLAYGPTHDPNLTLFGSAKLVIVELLTKKNGRFELSELQWFKICKESRLKNQESRL